MTSYTEHYLNETIQVVEQLDRGVIDRMVQLFVATREKGGRLFILGVGGSAGGTSGQRGHAVQCGSRGDRCSPVQYEVRNNNWLSTAGTGQK